MSRYLKRMMPTSLFGRALLILVLPVLLVQVIAAYVFYERHWASVSRQMSASLAGEVAWIVDGWEMAVSPAAQSRVLTRGLDYMGLRVKVLPPMHFHARNTTVFHFPRFEAQLRHRINRPFALRYQSKKDLVYILIPVKEAMLQVKVPEKRLVSTTTVIFIAWLLGASFILMTIAILFLRNQIRPIIQLANAAERFGKGQEILDFRPSGAREVRRAGTAFLDMRERLRRQVESRTAMLAGISHDLRTPLTRMKLQLAMLGEEPAATELQQDLSEMERMIEAYLAFARGEGGERAQKLLLTGWMEEIVAPYLRSNKNIILQRVPVKPVTLKPQAMKRVMQNLIDNSLRYGKQCWIGAKIRHHKLILIVEDDGPGIPEKHHEQVFQAFRRLEPSRNIATGGAGLGLTIVREIVHAHGGEVALEKSSHGGLKVVVSVPI